MREKVQACSNTAQLKNGIHPSGLHRVGILITDSIMWNLWRDTGVLACPAAAAGWLPARPEDHQIIAGRAPALAVPAGSSPSIHSKRRALNSSGTSSCGQCIRFQHHDLHHKQGRGMVVQHDVAHSQSRPFFPCLCPYQRHSVAISRAGSRPGTSQSHNRA